MFLLTDCGVYDIDGIKGLVSDHKCTKKDFVLSTLSIGDNIGYDLSEGSPEGLVEFLRVFVWMKT